MARKKITNAEEFKRAMDEIGKQTKQRVKLIHQKLLIDGFSFVVFASPEKYGYLRFNWDIVIGENPPEEKLKNPDLGKIYGQPRRKGTQTVRHDNMSWIYNNTDYAYYVENGTEKMSAQPMVAPAEQSLYRQTEHLCNALSKLKIP